ncbi:DUF6387 family protein [Serratia fonticola]|uniref:DUF6387 family protein n=1 Tax=Serratia fonticola TaxID=47917 RepID=UPI003AAD40FC
MRINKKNDLPSWFKMENYKFVSEIGDKELFYQLAARYLIIAENEFVPIDSERTLGNGFIENAESELVDFETRNVFENDNLGTLPQGGGVEPLSVHDVLGIYSDIQSSEITQDLTSESHNLITKITELIRSVNTVTDNYFNYMYVKIDLSWPDALLLSDIENLIPKWRQCISKEAERSLPSTSWRVAKRKIIDYALLPLIDLMIWEKQTGNKITNGVLAVAVFPEGDYDSTSITQTIKPTIEKMMDYFSIEQYKREIFDWKDQANS